MNKVHIENWAEMILSGDYDLTCPACKGELTVVKPKLACTCEDEKCGHTWTVEPDENITSHDHEIIEDLDFYPVTCPECEDEHIEVDDESEDVTCEDCDNGYIEPLWNTIWDTEMTAEGRGLPLEFGNVFAFDYDGTVAFGLTCCGQDCTPYLASAYVEMFGDDCCLPDEFMVTGTNLRCGYIRSCVGESQARKIYAAILRTAHGSLDEAGHIIDDATTALGALDIEKESGAQPTSEG